MIRTSLHLVFSAAIVSALGLTSCSSETEPVDPGGVDTDEDLAGESTFAAPDDDPSADDAAGLELTPESTVEAAEGSVDDIGDVGDVGDVGELDTDELSTPLAAKRVASPVPGRGVTYAYGVRNPRYAAGFHTGQDYASPIGRAVVAVRSGRIRWSNDRGGAYGRWIGLDADNGRTYVYCHLSSRRFKAGTRVTAGQRIGRVGASGNVTGPHLHLEDHPKGPFVYAQVRKPRW